MIKKNYTEEFRRDAVWLYRDTDTEGATGAGNRRRSRRIPRLPDHMAEECRNPDP